MLGLLLLLAFGVTLSHYPSCFDKDSTWASNDISSILTNVDDPTSCQESCQNHTDPCTDFTWFSSAATPMNNLCLLFLDPSTPIPCNNCISGPVSCVCGGNFACQVDDDNLVDMITSIQNQVICQEHCFQTSMCSFYTYFDAFSHPLKQTCLLFSSCSEIDFSCQGCSSGPADCRNISFISTSHPTKPATTTFFTTTIQPIVICDTPDPQEHGDWLCPETSAVVTCYLECHPGYVSNNGTVITCHDGVWSSTSSANCVAAIALITGGDSTLNSVEVYGDGVHQYLYNLPDERYYHSLSFTDSVLLLCGGGSTPSSCLSYSESQQWVSHSNTISKRYWHSSVSMRGKLHLLGGGPSQATTEHLNPLTTEWTGGWDLLESSYYACAAKIDPEMLIVIGGHSFPSSVISYNITSDTAIRLKNLFLPRYHHDCVYVRNMATNFRGVLVAGGTVTHNLSELYDINTGEWSSSGQLSSARDGVKMVVLGEKILAMGGYDGHYLSTVDSFNLTTHQWTASEEMLEARCWHAVTGIPASAVRIA